MINKIFTGLAVLVAIFGLMFAMSDGPGSVADQAIVNLSGLALFVGGVVGAMWMQRWL